MNETQWNGEPCAALRVTVTVADSGFFPEYWAREFVGTRRKAVRVEYGGDVFYLDDEDGSGWDKVTHGGSPRWGHRDLIVEPGSVEPRAVTEQSAQNSAGPASETSTERCTCGHLKGDHSGRRDHCERHPNIPHRPWCHVCETECIYCPPDADKPCPHENFDAFVDVNRITASDDDPTVVGYHADIKVNCADCDEPFRWTGVQAGSSPRQPMCSVDETELRASLRPASADPDFGLSLPGFAVNYRGPEPSEGEG